jgi:hypothetical protein
VAPRRQYPAAFGHCLSAPPLDQHVLAGAFRTDYSQQRVFEGMHRLVHRFGPRATGHVASRETHARHYAVQGRLVLDQFVPVAGLLRDQGEQHQAQVTGAENPAAATAAEASASTGPFLGSVATPVAVKAVAAAAPSTHAKLAGLEGVGEMMIVQSFVLAPESGLRREFPSMHRDQECS